MPLLGYHAHIAFLPILGGNVTLSGDPHMAINLTTVAAEIITKLIVWEFFSVVDR